MPDPVSYRPAQGEIPTLPGVYRFRDAHGTVIYVGKATNLRSRLTSYFADPATLHHRTASMVTTAASVDWVTVANEVEALTLEYAWIKEFEPRFNVKYRDDKSYPMVAITMQDEFPRVMVVREAKRKGSRYFGPYAHAWAIRQTLDELLKVFPMRSCSSGVFRSAKQSGRPCLLGYIDKCAAPCVGKVSPAQHRAIAEDMAAFLSGQSDRFVQELELEMADAANRQEYELAARLRDRIGALRIALERNAVVFADGTDADLIALAEDPLQIAVQVFHVRNGRIRGERSFIVERADDLAIDQYCQRILQFLYGQDYKPSIPKEVLLSSMPAQADVVIEWLALERGAAVDLRVPQRGDKRALMDTAATNAVSALALHKMRRSADLTSRSLALAELQDALSLPEAPLRIECIDISTLQGSDTVASLVVFEDGLARKSDYRTYIIKGPRTDDLASVAEVVTRRFGRATGDSSCTDTPSAGIQHAEATPTAAGNPSDAPTPVRGSVPAEGAPRSRVGYVPGLLVIDGGEPQVNTARATLDALGVKIPVVGLAKRMEELWLPGQSDPVILSRTSEALYLVQRIRDEAHRVAITFHRKRRSKRQVSSALDGIPGLGPAKARALLKHFGSVKNVAAAGSQDLQQVSGIGPALADTIESALRRTGQSQAVTTQETT